MELSISWLLLNILNPFFKHLGFCSIGPRQLVTQSSCVLEVSRDQPAVKVLPPKVFPLCGCCVSDSEELITKEAEFNTPIH